MAKKWLTVSEIATWAEREAKRMPPSSDGLTSEFVQYLTFEHAINGDESFSERVLLDLFWRTVHGGLLPTDRAMIAFVLNRMSQSKGAKRALSGVEKRGGQARRGQVGLSLSAEVSSKIRDDGLTVEEAWEAVGATHHLTASAVKGHWMRWKPTLLKSAESLLRQRYPDITESDVQARARVLVLGRRA